MTKKIINAIEKIISPYDFNGDLKNVKKKIADLIAIYGAGYGYRCDDCGAVIGSISMPRSCAILYKQEEEMKQVVDRLNGV